MVSKKSIQAPQVSKPISINTFSILVFVLAFITYLNTLNNKYVWDDKIVILENEKVQSGIKGIPKLFLKSQSTLVSDKYGYRPIVLISFALDYQFFGINPKASHFMNLLYFALLCLLIFKVLAKVFHEHSLLPPLLITILFIVHPIHTEVVANVKSRDEIFALLFSLFALSNFIQFNKLGKYRYLVFSILFYFLAFFSKESSFSMLFILPLVALYLNNWKGNSLIYISSAIMIGVVIISIVIVNVILIKVNDNSVPLEIGNFEENKILGNSFFYTWNWDMKLANAVLLLGLYLKSFFYPVTQLYFYGYNVIPLPSWNQLGVILSLIINGFLFLLAILRFKRNKEISLGILIYFICILFYTHLFRTLADTMADRFMFTPSLGLCIFTVYLIGYLFKIDFTKSSLDKVTNFYTFITTKVFTKKAFLFLIVCMALFYKTISRNTDWKDDWTLVSADMPKLENCSKAHYYYANVIYNSLKTNYNKQLEDSMIKHYQRSIEISDSASISYYVLSSYYCAKNDFTNGIAWLNKAIKVYPNNATFNLSLGQAYIMINQVTPGIYYLKKAKELAPQNQDLAVYLALAYSKANQFNEALNTLKLVKLKSDNATNIYEAYSTIYFEKAVYPHLINKDSTKNFQPNYYPNMALTIEELGYLDSSTNFALKSIEYGSNAKATYEKIIKRYDLVKNQEIALKYFNLALEKGIIKK